MNDKQTTDVGFVRRPDDGYPVCLKCNKPVNEVNMEAMIEEIHSWEGATAFYTGEVIVTVRCHGETWRASNFRGRL